VLARVRREVEPVAAEALARFLPSWQGVSANGLHGADGLLRAVEQLAGVLLPASALESLCCHSRVEGYSRPCSTR